MELIELKDIVYLQETFSMHASFFKATIIELNSELSNAQLRAEHIEKKTSTNDEVVDFLEKAIFGCNASMENLKLERANDLSALEQKCVEVIILRYELDNLNLLKKDEEYLQLASKVVASEASSQELNEKVEKIEQDLMKENLALAAQSLQLARKEHFLELECS